MPLFSRLMKIDLHTVPAPIDPLKKKTEYFETRYLPNIGWTKNNARWGSTELNISLKLVINGLKVIS